MNYAYFPTNTQFIRQQQKYSGISMKTIYQMGSAQSRKGVHLLTCPKDFDDENFKKICTLFDKLDNDSNLGVSSDELRKIAKLHVKNCCRQLGKRLKAEEESVERQLVEIEEKCAQDIERIRFQAATAKQSARQQSKYAQANIRAKIDKYSGLDEDGQENVFMKVLVPNDESHIDFWTFFEYMKTRTGDIENIEETDVSEDESE
jgi:Ca2+-binding EF-hand superfamily protein